MYGIVSLLDDAHDARIKGILNEIQDVSTTSIPHLSYHVAPTYELNTLKPVLSQLAGKTQSFRMKTSGLGVFTGPEPVLYITVVATRFLLDFQKSIWGAVDGNTSDSVEHYCPDNWMPHITLAQRSIDHDSLRDRIRFLSERDFSWNIEINNLAVIFDEDSQQGWRLASTLVDNGRN
jgi:2'-5' RNA ligase